MIFENYINLCVHFLKTFINETKRKKNPIHLKTVFESVWSIKFLKEIHAPLIFVIKDSFV